MLIQTIVKQNLGLHSGVDGCGLRLGDKTGKFQADLQPQSTPAIQLKTQRVAALLQLSYEFPHLARHEWRDC